ncbi:hypothetical protein CPB83DRAFT_805989 [Crepidotus variabilis]|uniref:Nucleoside diphosphate kinase n=1 Tax=Crepidotus variabilis TaxID=179855 RepID=A0A9P6ENN0_9AGAR|nr:hypothetical protein CPB83DRAFT_805989 [Crepidotus variabilis]
MSASPSQSPELQDNIYADGGHAEYEHNYQDRNVLLELQDVSPSTTLSRSVSSNTTPITRTVAIIKTHALNHRFDIERRIQEASFEISKERQMEFDTETDPDTLYELFGEDTDSLAEGPVWVYVLERRRAVEVWNTLMGDRDVDTARQQSPNSLRALYGISSQQNGLMGSPDVQTAEIQISALFASSPPFPTSELPGEDTIGKFGSIRSVASGMLEQVKRAALDAGGEDEGYAPSSSATNPSTVGGSPGRRDSNGKPLFKARLVPATHDKPDIVPRTTKAAALRAGLLLDKPQEASRPRAPVSKERLAQTFANVPGHKRNSTIAVASTAAPTIAPRMTKAASLRLGHSPIAPPIRQRSVTVEAKKTFEGIPGHKRRETISVASIKAPTVAPRLNKSSALRAQKEQAPPVSFMFKAIPPTPARSSSRTSLSPPNLAPRPASQASATVGRASSALARRQSIVPTSSYTGATRKSLAPALSTPNGTSEILTPPAQDDNSLTPTTPGPARPASVASTGKPRPRPSSIGAPSIAPRLNKSAALRAAKQEAEQAEKAKVAAKLAAKKRAPPSSFKAVV